MENVNLMKVSGVCAILTGTISVAAFIILIVATDFVDADGGAEFLTAAHNDNRAVAVALWLFVLGPMLALMGVLGLYQALRDQGSLVRVAAVFFLLGVPLALSRVFLELGVVYELAPRYIETAANSATSASLVVVADTIRTVGILANLVGNVLLFGIGVLLFSVAIIRTSVVPRWIGWLGVLAAVVGGWLPLLGPAFSVIEFIGLIGFFLSTAWMISMGVSLLRLEESAMLRFKS